MKVHYAKRTVAGILISGMLLNASIVPTSAAFTSSVQEANAAVAPVVITSVEYTQDSTASVSPRGVLVLRGNCKAGGEKLLAVGLYLGEGTSTNISKVKSDKVADGEWTATVEGSKKVELIKFADGNYNLIIDTQGSGASVSTLTTTTQFLKTSFEIENGQIKDMTDFAMPKQAQAKPSVSLNNSNATVGQAAQVKANASGGESTGAYEYQSSDTSVATIDANGVVTPLKAGSTDITAIKKGDDTYDDSEASDAATLTVTAGTQSITGQSYTVTKNSTPLTLTPTLFSLTWKDAAGKEIAAANRGAVSFYDAQTSGSQITTLDISSEGEKKVYAEVAAVTDYYEANTTRIALTVNVTNGEPTYVSGTAAGGSYIYKGTLTGALKDTGLSPSELAKNLRVTTVNGGSGEDLTTSGTWTFKNENESLTAGTMPVDLVWTPNDQIGGKDYAPVEAQATVSVKKELAAADVEPVDADKAYDGSATLPDTAKLKVKDGSKVNNEALTFTINGQYCAGAADSTADVNAADPKYFVVTGVTDTEHTLRDSVYYVMPSDVSMFIVGGAKIEKVTPELKLGNLTQTVGSVGEATVTATPEAKLDADKTGITVEYEIEKSAKVEAKDAVHCNCGAGNALAHLPECDKAKDNGQACTCATLGGAAPDGAVAGTTQHTADCAYTKDPANGKCDCGKGDEDAAGKGVADSHKHNDLDCAYAPKIEAAEAETEWLEWNAKTTADPDKTAGEVIKAAAAGTKFNVRAYIPTETTNFGAIAEGSAVKGELVVNAKSSGGGSSSGGSSSGGTSDKTTTTTTNPDGSKTTTVTDKKTGTVTATTKYADGSTKVVETKKDGTVTQTGTSKDGVKVVAVIDTKDSVDATVTLPSSVKSAKVTIPTPKVTAGTVLIEVGANGEQIAKKTVVSEGSIELTLTASARFKIVDRSKSFSDVTAADWAHEPVTFVTARELFNGVSDTEFGPKQPMTRGMLAAVLYRLEDAKDGGTPDFSDVAAGQYYTEAIAWAAKRGVVTGLGDGRFSPEGSITREQLAAMLYRYANAPSASGGAAAYPDAAQVSDWAAEAVNWAVSVGIIKGDDDGRLNPQGNATRAEVATMLTRFIQTQA